MSRNAIYFETILGKRIFCFLHQPDVPHKKMVIMSHGFEGTSTGDSRAFVNFACILVAHGITVLRFDQPNCGNSDGDFLDVSFDEWVNTIAYHAKKYATQGYQVALLLSGPIEESFVCKSSRATSFSQRFLVTDKNSSTK